MLASAIAPVHFEMPAVPDIDVDPVVTHSGATPGNNSLAANKPEVNQQQWAPLLGAPMGAGFMGGSGGGIFLPAGSTTKNTATSTPAIIPVSRVNRPSVSTPEPGPAELFVSRCSALFSFRSQSDGDDNPLTNPRPASSKTSAKQKLPSALSYRAASDRGKSQLAGHRILTSICFNEAAIL